MCLVPIDFKCCAEKCSAIAQFVAVVVVALRLLSAVSTKYSENGECFGKLSDCDIFAKRN